MSQKNQMLNPGPNKRSDTQLAEDLLKGAKEIARFTGFSERRVFYLASTGELRSLFKVGRKLYARRSSLLREIQLLEEG